MTSTKKQIFDSVCHNCKSLNISFSFDNKQRTLREMVPDNFCILAFHSVYPYMFTLYNGGWIDWVNYDEHVIVNCPHPGGIAMYVKGSPFCSSKNVIVEVMQTSTKCCMKYKLGDKFNFHFTEENALYFNMVDKIVPFCLGVTGKSDNSTEFSVSNFTCDSNGRNFQFQVKFE